MIPKSKRRTRPLTVLAYVVTVVFMGMILFPLFMIASYAMRDNTALNRDPSALVPECAKTMEIVLDYTGFKELDDETFLDTIQRDALFAMYSGSAEMDGEAIGEYKIFGVLDDKTIYISAPAQYAATHTAGLWSLYGAGALRQRNFDRR